MLKKLGIIVGGSLAVLVAASPLAFADTSRSPECSFDASADNSVSQEGVGGDALLGLVGGAVAQVGTPANVQTQAPVASCNNIEDVLDTNIEDNLQDNDEDNDEIDTDIEDSFNSVED